MADQPGQRFTALLHKVVWETFTCFSSAVNLGFCSPVENRACPTAFSMTGVKVANRCLYKVKYRPSTSHVKLDYIAAHLVLQPVTFSQMRLVMILSCKNVSENTSFIDKWRSHTFHRPTRHFC